MCFISYSWVMMTLMMVAMLYFLGPRHPRVIDGVRAARRAAATPCSLFAIVMFVLCFTPVPIDPL